MVTIWYAMIPSGYRYALFFGVIVQLSLAQEIELHIGTLIPSLDNDKYQFKKAMELANETIRDQGLLKGYKLVFHHKKTWHSASGALDSLIEFRAMNVVKICILGPARPDVAFHTAQLAEIWGPLQVTYGTGNPELMANGNPRFLSVVPTPYSMNRALFEFIKVFKWKRVALAYDVENKGVYLPTINALKDKLKANKMEILTDEGLDFRKKQHVPFIRSLKEKDARILVVLLKINLISFMCEAYKQNFYGKKIVWITYNPNLNVNRKKYDCNETVVDVVSEGMFTLSTQFLRKDDRKTISGLTVKNYTNIVRSKSSSIAFDTVWLLALSLNNSLDVAEKIQQLNIRTKTGQYFKLLEQLRARMVSMNFEGISGRVSFNSSERLGTIIIKQRRNRRLSDVAQHFGFSNRLTFFPNQSKPEILFKGSKYVQDGPRYLNQVRHYSLALFIVIWILCGLAVIVALLLFYFNFKNREIRYIKMSSPHVNNIIIFGGLLCFIKVILDTLDSRFLSLETYGRFCNARVWMMSLGFTTAFGAMFSKTWRVHRIFTASKNFRRAVIKNFHLYGLLVALLAVDCILLTLWMVISPYKSGTLLLPTEENKEMDEIIHPYVFTCHSEYQNYFLVTTLGCKGLLLVFGIFLAWETRNIEIKALNDSKYIGISVYNVVILSVVGVILATLMASSEHHDIYLALMSLVVIICTAATLGIVFVPKIIGLQRIIKSTTAGSVETTYSVKSSEEGQSPCCCCEDCKCRCSGRGRKASVHVSNKFLAGASSNRRKSRNASVPSISVTKPKVSVHINARVSLSAYPISESPSPSPEESPRVGILSGESGT